MRGIARGIALVGAMALLSGCWVQVGFGPEHRRHNDVESDLTVDNAATLTELWSADVPGDVSEPVVSDGRVYVTRANSSPSASVGARALAARTGATVWDTQLLPGGSSVVTFPTAAALANGELWAGGAGVLTFPTARCGANHGRLDPDDGTILATSPDDLFSPAVDAGDVVVQTTTLFSDANTHCAGGPLVLTVRDGASLATLWSATLPGEQSGPLVPLYSLPTVADGRVYVANGTTLSAYILDGCGAETCDPLWSVDLGGAIDRSTPVATSTGEVVVTLTAGQVVAVEGTSGIEQWRALTDHNPPDNPPSQPPTQLLAAVDDTVYVTTVGTGTGSNRLLAYPTSGCDADLCSPTWVGTTSATLTSPPTVAGGVVYVGADGAVLAFDAAGCGSSTCAPFASIPLDGAASAITIANGRLYTSGPGHVTAFAPT